LLNFVKETLLANQALEKIKMARYFHQNEKALDDLPVGL